MFINTLPLTETCKLTQIYRYRRYSRYLRRYLKVTTAEERPGREESPFPRSCGTLRDKAKGKSLQNRLDF